MLSDAIREIDSAREASEAQRRELLAIRRSRHRLDTLIERIESMLEHDQREVPETLIREISILVRPIHPKLYRQLRRNRERDAVRVLDTLFDAQQEILPRLARTA